MQPDQPTPNYDFIMNPAQTPKKTPLGGSSMATRILVVVGGLFVLVIIAGIAIRLLAGGGGGGFDKAAMLSVVQDQSEIIRLSTVGGQDSVSQTNKNFSVTAQLSMQSEQQSLLSYMSERGYSPEPKTLGLKRSTKTDTQLADAKSSSSFDTVYKSVMEQHLQTYKRSLTTAYDGASSKTAKAELSARFDAADLLITQLTGVVDPS